MAETVTRGDMQAVIDAARSSAAPQVLFKQDGHYARVFIPPGAGGGQGSIADIDLEQYELRPLRKRGSVTVFSPESFNLIVANNRDAGDVTVYVDRDPSSPSVVAVLNGPGASGPGWGDCRVMMAFRPTPQWRRWLSHDGKFVMQVEFAEFVDDNMADIADPPGATMLEIVSYLQSTRSTEFKSAVRLTSGTVQFQNIENDTTKVGTGQVEVPETFTLGIEPMLGVGAYKVPARFRYRLANGKLALGYKLQRMEDLMNTIVSDIVAKIATDGISIVEGTPPNGI